MGADRVPPGSSPLFRDASASGGSQSDATALLAGYGGHASGSSAASSLLHSWASRFRSLIPLPRPSPSPSSSTIPQEAGTSAGSMQGSASSRDRSERHPRTRPGEAREPRKYVPVAPDPWPLAPPSAVRTAAEEDPEDPEPALPPAMTPHLSQNPS